MSSTSKWLRDMGAEVRNWFRPMAGIISHGIIWLLSRREQSGRPAWAATTRWFGIVFEALGG